MDGAAPQAAGGTPIEQMTEDELLVRARTAMERAAALPPGSTGRAIQWAVFDATMAELDRRAIRFVLGKLGC
jgi:hypothetical protein